MGLFELDPEDAKWYRWVIPIGTCIKVAMIVVGSVFINDCHHQPFIPIHLIVEGVLFLLRLLLRLCEEASDTVSRKSKYFTGVYVCFTLTWFIAGNVWVFGIYMPDDASCNTHLYLFSLVFICGTWIFFGILLCGLCCYGCCKCLDWCCIPDDLESIPNGVRWSERV